jgi:hypothetical protein
MSIPEYARTNFNTLLRAAANGDHALVECADAVTDEPAMSSELYAHIGINLVTLLVTPKSGLCRMA